MTPESRPTCDEGAVRKLLHMRGRGRAAMDIMRIGPIEAMHDIVTRGRPAVRKVAMRRNLREQFASWQAMRA